MTIKHVLLVDDESVVRMTTGLILKKIGCTVIAFDNGVEALAHFKEHSDEIDIAIIDSHMPEMSGADLFKELKLVNPSLVAIMASGFLNEEEMAESSNAGFTAVINKPFHITELKQLLETL